MLNKSSPKSEIVFSKWRKSANIEKQVRFIGEKSANKLESLDIKT